MATSSRQNFLKESFNRQVVPCLIGAGLIHAGDLLFWDTFKGGAVPASASAGNFIGVAYNDSDIPQLATSAFQFNRITVQRRGTYRAFSTSGDTYGPYDVVYVGADAQTVTKVAGSSTAVGYVDPEGIVKANTTSKAPPLIGIAGGAGVLIDVNLTPNYPSVSGAVPG